LSKQTDEHATAQDWVELLARDYQDDITRGLYKGVYALPEKELDAVMACQARDCVQAFFKLYDLPDELDLDAFLERMTTGGSSKIDIERDGDTILWRERHAGQCMCPLVRRNVITLKPGLCHCAVHWLRMLIERYADRSARVELIESAATGVQDCVFRITLTAAKD